MIREVTKDLTNINISFVTGVCFRGRVIRQVRAKSRILPRRGVYSVVNRAETWRRV